MRFVLVVSLFCGSLSSFGSWFYVSAPVGEVGSHAGTFRAYNPAYGGLIWSYPANNWSGPMSSSGFECLPAGDIGKLSLDVGYTLVEATSATLSNRVTGVVTSLAQCGDAWHWSFSAPVPAVTNTLHSVCITNRTPLPRAVLVQVGSGAAWEVVSSQNLIVLASGQEWCASYVVEGPPDATAVCATLVDPASLASPFIAAWGRVCGSQSITTNPPTSSVVAGTITSPPLSNRLASVYGTNVSSLLSSTGALTGQNLGAFLAGMTDLTGAGSGAGGSSSGVTGGGSWTNAGISGGVSNGVPWDGSNIVSAVGHLEGSLTNGRAVWEGTNGWAESASAQYQIGANALGGAWNTGGSNLFGSAIVGVRDIGHGWDSDVADSALDIRLRNLSEQSGQRAVLDKIKPSFNPWAYPGFRRICILVKRFRIWFGTHIRMKR